MAPRGQKKKVGLTRMDAAIDAMLPYGFARKHVRKVVNQLLKEYGGNDGWPFIEGDAYRELLDAILRDVEASEYGNSSKDKSDDEKLEHDAPAEIAGPSETSCSEPVNTSSGTNNSNAEGVGKGSDIDEAANADENPEKKEHSPRYSPITAPPPSNAIPSEPPSTNNLPTRRHFREMEAATSMIALKETLPTMVSSDGNKSMRKRKSRWDQKPDDP